jgi:CBS domain-containing protein
MRVVEVMSTPVWTVGMNDAADDAWELMRLYGTHHLVVVDRDGRVAGVVSTADLGGELGAPLRRGRRVEDLMTERVATVTPETPVRQAAILMRAHGVDYLPVLGDGELRGIVTARDLLELIGRATERPAAVTARRKRTARDVRPHPRVVAKRTRRARGVG